MWTNAELIDNEFRLAGANDAERALIRTRVEKALVRGAGLQRIVIVLDAQGRALRNSEGQYISVAERVQQLRRRPKSGAA